MSVVYFIQFENGGPIKIGFASDLPKLSDQEIREHRAEIERARDAIEKILLRVGPKGARA